MARAVFYFKCYEEKIAYLFIAGECSFILLLSNLYVRYVNG